MADVRTLQTLLETAYQNDAEQAHEIIYVAKQAGLGEEVEKASHRAVHVLGERVVGEARRYHEREFRS